MADEADYPRLYRLLPVVASVSLLGVACLVDNAIPQSLQIGLIVAACCLFVAGLAARRRRIRLAVARISLSIISITALVAGCELACRMAGFDFNELSARLNNVPIYYRFPTVHAGEGVFRRRGPASWHGKVLAGYMRIHGQPDGPYSDEQPVTVKYDREGFRNPPTLTNWDIVVTGDSFVELGYLPDDQLFTSVAARRLGCRIKNLGVSGTGPFSQTFYLRNYGKAPSTRKAVLCFFEGNDIADLDRELRNRDAVLSKGVPFEQRKQTSLMEAVRNAMRPKTGKFMSMAPNAVLVSARPERPMTVWGNPPSFQHLSRRQQAIVGWAVTNWYDTVRSNGMEPLLMYLPDSHRVYHGLIRYADTNSAVAQWKPGDFAADLGTFSSNVQMRFINTLPALRKEAEAGRIPYNLIGDTHLTAEGSRVVGEVLATALAEKWENNKRE